MPDLNYIENIENNIPGTMQRYNEEVINNNGELFLVFCTQNELGLNNTFSPTKINTNINFVIQESGVLILTLQ